MTDAPQPAALFGLPNMTDLVGKLPGIDELHSLKNDFDEFTATVDKLSNFLDQYSFIPGAQQVVGPLKLVDRGLLLVKKLIDFVP